VLEIRSFPSLDERFCDIARGMECGMPASWSTSHAVKSGCTGQWDLDDDEVRHLLAISEGIGSGEDPASSLLPPTLVAWFHATAIVGMSDDLLQWGQVGQHEPRHRDYAEPGAAAARGAVAQAGGDGQTPVDRAVS
jgi:hypothetical protein